MSYRPELNNIPFLPRLNVQEYERYNPTAFNDSLTILEKINKMIYQMNKLGELTNDMFEQWNELVKWILGNGLNEIVSEEIQKRIDDGTFDDLFNKILGDLSNLETIDKETIVGAINEVNQIALKNKENIGEMDELTTPTKDSLVGAINDLKTQFDINEQAVITIGEATGHGIIKGLKVTQQSVLAMSVQVGIPGQENIVHMINGVRYTPASIALPIEDSHPTQDRIDIVYVDVDGVIKVSTGVFSLTPIPPQLPVGAELLAFVNVPKGDTTVNNSDIVDKRAIKALSHLKTVNKENLVLAINNVYDLIVESNGDINKDLEKKIQDILDILGDKDTINVKDTSTFVSAINEVISIIGSLNNLTTENKTTIVDAINDIVTRYATIDYVDRLIESVNEKIGDLNDLTGLEKTDLVKAINEVREKYISEIYFNNTIGYLTDLQTEVKTTIVGAINELVAKSLTKVEGTEMIRELTEYMESRFEDVDAEFMDLDLELTKKALKVDVGDKSKLETYNKTNLVDAINELRGGISSTTSRGSVMYFDHDSFRVSIHSIPLNGFRFRGQPTKVATDVMVRNPLDIIGISTNLGAQTSMTYDTWYATFGVKRDDDTYGMATMPMIRASSVLNNVFYFGKSGEFSTAGDRPDPAPSNYTFPTDSLVGCDVLVINEKVGNRKGMYSGRVTKVVNNNNTSVTLEDIGGIEAGDYILIAPPNVKGYGYVCSYYVDAAELRNISDSGMDVKATMVYLANDAKNMFAIDGALNNYRIDFRGFINPLSTGINLALAQSFRTTETAEWAFYTYSDSSGHYIDTAQAYKGAPGNENTMHNIAVPFTFGQTLFFGTGGNETLLRNCVRKMQIKGWMEV